MSTSFEAMDKVPFNEILIGLTKSMENGAKSLFFLQRATIDDAGSDPFPEKCRVYRSNLQQKWEAIIAFVEDTSEFASEARCVQAVFSTDGWAEINVYFESLCEKCRNLDEASQVLLWTHHTPPTPYDSYWENQANRSHPYTDEAEAQREYNSDEDAHPDGHEAYAAFQRAKEGLDQFLKQMAYFWSDTKKEFTELAGLPSLKQQYIDDRAKKWEEYRLASITASVNMTNAADALVIRAVGTSKRRSEKANGWDKARVYISAVASRVPTFKDDVLGLIERIPIFCGSMTDSIASNGEVERDPGGMPNGVNMNDPSTAEN